MVVLFGPKPELPGLAFFSCKFAHLPEAALTHFALCVGQHSLAVATVGEPIAFVNVPARPCKDSEPAHVASLPLTIITLCFECVATINCNLPRKKALSMILALLPFAGVSTLSLVKDQVAKRVCLAFKEVAKIDLFDFLWQADN